MKKGPFANFPLEYKRKLVQVWKHMSTEDREHFINQVTYALAAWGTDKDGRELVAVVIEKLLEDGSMNLADFGLYVDWLMEEGVGNIYPDKERGVKKALSLINSYRLRYELPMTPTKSIV
ncbi:MAG: hypothetical protein D6769_02330 [Methanobacteriota archaeon]|nr:MAG: hypothetical protein D6769_02330 [Euryarchaeota archaeon]